jgi:hypothetical protein
MTVDVRQKNLQGKLEAVAEAADKFADELKVLVKERIAAADVVFAVWQDDTAPLGFGFMAIKGQQRLHELTDTDVTLAPSMTGIKCSDAEQAEALLHVAGEPDRRH